MKELIAMDSPVDGAQIRTINAGGVNCYLVKTVSGFILVDTGFSSGRKNLEAALASAGCKPGEFKLVVLTHGDFDHSGNAAYLRAKYGARIAIHREDSDVVKRGDQDWNRKAKPDRFPLFFRAMGRLVTFFVRSVKFETFEPDLTIDEGYDLPAYGLAAEIVHLPGHSKGSIGILTGVGDLVCGDLLANMLRPGLHFMIDNLADAKASLEELGHRAVRTVYPGHGKAFLMSTVWRADRRFS
jgi:glyoxylase-like metal-dependent hydrolase (beta-lactamase superfamily II)